MVTLVAGQLIFVLKTWLQRVMLPVAIAAGLMVLSGTPAFVGSSAAQPLAAQPGAADALQEVQPAASKEMREQPCLRFGYFNQRPVVMQTFERIAAGLAARGGCAELITGSPQRLTMMLQEGRLDVHLARIKSNPQMDPKDVIRIDPAIVATRGLLAYRRAKGRLSPAASGFDMQAFRRHRTLAFVSGIVWQQRMSAGFAHKQPVPDVDAGLKMLMAARVDGLLLNKIQYDLMGLEGAEIGAHQLGALEGYMFLSRRQAHWADALSMIAREAFVDGPLELGSATAR